MESCNSLSEFPYAEAAAAAAGKRAPPSPKSLPAPWTTSITESITACTEDRVFAIGGFDVRTQRVVAYIRMWDAAAHVWTRLPDAPVRVSHAGAVAVPGDSSLLLFGGWDGEGCNAELWHLHPHRSDVGGIADSLQSSARRSTSTNGSPAAVTTAPSNGKGRASKAGENAVFQWDRIEADSRVSARPVGRYAHAMAAGAAPTAARLAGAPRSPPSAAVRSTAAEPTAAAFTATGILAQAATESVIYVFGGNDTSSRLNDVWRLWVTPSVEQQVSHWERLEVVPGVSPCPREDAVLAFDDERKCLWVYGGRTASGTLDDLWCLSLADGRTSQAHVWTPVQPLGGHSLGPTRRDLSPDCLPAAALVESGCLYLSFADTPESARRVHGNDRVPLYSFCLTTHQWRPLSLAEDEQQTRPSTAARTSVRSVQQPTAFRFPASCACGRFLYWLKDASDDETPAALSTPGVVCVELNMPATKPAKRRTERNR